MLERSIQVAGAQLLRAPRAVWLAIAAAWMSAIWIVSSLETGPGKPQLWLSWLLNCGHAFEFGLLSLWLALALLPRTQPSARVGTPTRARVDVSSAAPRGPDGVASAGPVPTRATPNADPVAQRDALQRAPSRAAARAWTRLEPRDIALVFAIVLAWAVLDEWHQSHVFGRDSTPFDIVTDVCGSLGVLWIARTAGMADVASVENVASVSRARESRIRSRFAIVFALCALAGLASTLH